MKSRLSAVVLIAGFGATTVAAAGCEYLVELDRGVVDAGGDSGCPICGDVDGGGSDGRAPAPAAADAVAPVEAAAVDAGPVDASAGDAGAERY